MPRCRHTSGSLREMHYLAGNRLTLLENGTAYFPALLAAIESARDSVHLETYLFADDPTGRAICSALEAAAARGVRVRVLADGFGARHLPTTLMPRLLDQGVEVMLYRPELARFSLHRHRLRRLHRKLAIIDGRIGFVGGINLIDDLNHPEPAPSRYDYAVRIEGPLLGPLQRTALRLWQVVAWANFQRRFRLPGAVRAVTTPVGHQRAALVLRNNLRHRRDIENAYLQAIGAARAEILIANAYFLPGLRFRHALMAAAARGVRVTVLLQGRTDHPFLHYATQALYASLLDAGIRIHEYHVSYLHAKVAVVDERWATVGSSNIDPFSLLVAKEANVVVDDPGFARQLRHGLLDAIGHRATELRREDWLKRPYLARLLRWSAYQGARLMIGLAGYGGQL